MSSRKTYYKYNNNHNARDWQTWCRTIYTMHNYTMRYRCFRLRMCVCTIKTTATKYEPGNDKRYERFFFPETLSHHINTS